MTVGRLAILLILSSPAALVAQGAGQGAPDWTRLQDETMQHYQAVLRIDTRNPPGNETVLVEYLKQVLEKEGIPAQIVGSDPKRANLVARLKGNGSKRPLLIMGHSDTVTTDDAKWRSRR
jgi:acetylornithine deacetylase/succinyl-diaminopimelate desuccinylase-like protein